MEKNFSLFMKKNILWTAEQEQLLVTWAEKSSGYAWLHSQSVNYFKHRNLYISIPAAFFGYIAGATTLLTESGNNVLKGFIGISAILAGLLTNFQEIFTFKEEGEKHKISSLRFLSFFREISCELSIAPQHRHSPLDYINIKRIEFDKMLEQSPNIPPTIVDLFNSKFKTISIHKPDIVNGLQTIMPFGEQMPKTYYFQKTSIYDKIVLLRYFSLWKVYWNERRLQYKKPNIEITNMRERDKGYTHLHAPLSKQKK